MKLSIIIPVYNEENTIDEVLTAVESVELPGGVEREIVVVDDGSTDKTKEILKAYEEHPLVKIYSFEENQGKTFAVKVGLEKVRGDIILIQDADLEYSPKHYPLLIDPILNQKATIVYGSRFKGHIANMTWVNRLANRISNITINFLFNAQITDFHTCLKVFKRDVIKELQIVSKNFSFDTEVTARLLRDGHQIYEVPIDYVARKREEGKKITWGTALESYFFLWKYRFFSKK